MKKIIWIPLLVFLISCQPSKITQSWTAKNVTPKKYQKILVLGVLTEADKDLQIKMEDHLSGDLKEMGYNAVAANKIFPAGTFVKGDTTRAVAALNGKGFDAILTIVLLDKMKEKQYIPGRMTYYTNQEQFNRFDRYYNSMSERIFTPGYYTEETKYIWENNFYDLSSKKLIYSTRTRSFDIPSKNTLAHSYGLLMIKSLVGKNILIKPEKTDEE
jgi:hypothetical protein